MSAAELHGNRGTNSILQAATDSKEVKSAHAREKCDSCNVLPSDLNAMRWLIQQSSQETARKSFSWTATVTALTAPSIISSKLSGFSCQAYEQEPSLLGRFLPLISWLSKCSQFNLLYLSNFNLSISGRWISLLFSVSTTVCTYGSKNYGDKSRSTSEDCRSLRPRSDYCAFQGRVKDLLQAPKPITPQHSFPAALGAKRDGIIYSP